jgi:hypothetical protein
MRKRILLSIAAILLLPSCAAMKKYNQAKDDLELQRHRLSPAQYARQKYHVECDLWICDAKDKLAYLKEIDIEERYERGAISSYGKEYEREAFRQEQENARRLEQAERDAKDAKERADDAEWRARNAEHRSYKPVVLGGHRNDD